MRQIGNYKFPEQGNTTEIEQWRPHVTRIALHKQVLVVARTRLEGTWKAYCAPVAGENHDHEWESVLRHGSQLPEDLARAIFAEFDGIPYAK